MTATSHFLMSVSMALDGGVEPPHRGSEPQDQIRWIKHDWWGGEGLNLTRSHLSSFPQRVYSPPTGNRP